MDAGQDFFKLYGENYENYHYRADFSYELRIIKVSEFFLLEIPSSNKNSNYHKFRINQGLLY
jgi:hypothetical protein